MVHRLYDFHVLETSACSVFYSAVCMIFVAIKHDERPTELVLKFKAKVGKLSLWLPFLSENMPTLHPSFTALPLGYDIFVAKRVLSSAFFRIPKVGFGREGQSLCRYHGCGGRPPQRRSRDR